MKVSTKGRYALRLIVDLGVNGGEDKYISLKDISARQNISIKYLEQITVGFWEGMYKVISDYVDSVSLKQLIDEHMSRQCPGCQEK